MSSGEIRKKFLSFFKERGHAIVPSSSLLPEGDTTTLFIGSGMQPLLQYFLGKPHPEGKRIANSQKSFRAEDIEEVGDNRHTTFFEMLGNWSFGDYFKGEQLPWLFEFLTMVIGLDPQLLYVTVFAGDNKNSIPKDEESAAIWKKLFKGKGIEAKDVMFGTEEQAAAAGMGGGRIFYYGKKNWWSRTGAPDTMPVREPGGPDSEVFYEFTEVRHDTRYGAHCHPNCDCGRFMEIGNSVFMEYRKTENGTFEKLPTQNVDFGGGLERIEAASNNDPDIFHINIFRAMAKVISFSKTDDRAILLKQRVILDHIRASVFLVADGVSPSNKGQGYILRRLLRRSMVHAQFLGLPDGWFTKLVNAVGKFYGDVYGEILINTLSINRVLHEEYERFKRIIEEGMKEFKQMGAIKGADVFRLHQSFGFPFELTRELARERGIEISKDDFDKEFKKHQEISRAGKETKFGGHGLYLKTGEVTVKDKSELEKVTRLHTATHLMHAGLRAVLGPEVRQNGSDITVERTRFDFNFPRKVMPEELEKVESWVNEAIKKDLTVELKETTYEEAIKERALGFFRQKYPERVKVYTMYNEKTGEVYSKELCGGPHVTHTGEVGEFKISKEEAVGSGVRRIRGIISF